MGERKSERRLSKCEKHRALIRITMMEKGKGERGHSHDSARKNRRKGEEIYYAT